MANGSLSPYLANKLLDHALGTASYTAPATVYLGLLLGDPEQGGTEVTEGTGYVRQATTFISSVNGGSSNAAEKTFTASGGSWGQISFIGLYDALSGGNTLFSGAVDVPKLVSDGESATVSIGDLTIGLA